MRKIGMSVLLFILMAVFTLAGNDAVAQYDSLQISRRAMSYDLARSIMVDDFISPDEISASFGFIYTERQLSHFVDTLPSEETLRWAKAYGYAVVAGPPAPVNIAILHAFHPKFFISSFDGEKKGWYLDQPFAKNDQVSSNWLIIKKEPLTESLDKYWIDQAALLSGNESVPNAAEMSWFMISFYKVRHRRLLKEGYTRTSSLVSNGNHVIIGFFGDNGMLLHSYWDMYDGRTIGIVPKLLY